MLPLHLMSLHEISKREERTMALCVKKLNSTCPWDDQTATTAASPSTSTPPSTARICNDNTSFSVNVIGLLRRLWREFNVLEYVKAGKCQYTATALQFCVRVGLLHECNRARLSSDVPSASNVSLRRRNGNFYLADRVRYELQSNAGNQQRWLQLRKYWRHNARRRLRKIEREQYVQHLPVDGGIAEESAMYISTIKNLHKCSCNSDINDNIFHDIVCRYRRQDSKELLWRHFRLLEFRYNHTFQHEYKQQQYLQQTKLRTLREWCRSFDLQQQQISTRTIFQHLDETIKGQSNIVTAKSNQIPTRPSHPYHAGNLYHDLFSALLCCQLPDKLYINTTCRNSRRRTICDSMSPIFLARSKKRLPIKTFACMSERTRPSVRMLQPSTLVSHPRSSVDIK